MDPVYVLSCKNFSERFLDELRAISPRLVINQHTTENGADVPREVWERVEVLYTWGALPDPAWAPRLRWIQLDTAGANVVLMSPLWHTDMTITTLNGMSPPNMAEHVFMMIIALNHGLPLILRLQQIADWPSSDFRWQQFTPRELRGTTLGVIGYGNIGREIGRIGHAFGMRVLGTVSAHHASCTSPTFKIPELMNLTGSEADCLYTPDELLDMLPQCDYVVLVVPLTTSTYHMINENALRAMKRSAILVNVARGAVVVEKSLIQALQERWIAGAALDVFEQEPLSADSPLWGMPNVIISPHIAGLTSHYEERIRAIFGENLRCYLAGQPLINQVDRIRGY